MDRLLSKKIQTKLLRWFEKKGRDLPWRRTQDPYAIWISEVMLQQTQVATAIPYYEKFLRAFPTVRDLARADLSRVLKVWEGLGYYSRARNLHRAAQMVLRHFGGEIPGTLDDLLNLPGIGRSTAGAILSIAFNKKFPILDGNVKRVLSRLFVTTRENFLWEIAESLIPEGEARSFNQALMDLGATLCTPMTPKCQSCPLRSACKAKASGNPERYPPRRAKKKIPHVHAVAGVIQKDGKVLLRQRPPSGLLGGLWEFPNWKAEEESRSSLLKLKNRVRKELEVDVRIEEPLGVFKHTFSHFKLTLHVYRCKVLSEKGNQKWVPLSKLHQLPMSALHRRIARRIDQGLG